MARSLLLPILLAACSCSTEPVPRGPAAAQAVAVAPLEGGAPIAQAAPAAPPAAPATTVAVTTMKNATAGAAITLRGHPAKIIWQHMTTGVAGKKLAYFDLLDGKEQTVVYWKDPPACSGDVDVTGRVVEVRGPSKRRGGDVPGQATKVDDSYWELHVDVESARCAP